MKNQLVLSFAKLGIASTLILPIQPVLAVQFSLVEMRTDEGFIYNEPSDSSVPTGENNVTEFKVEWNNNGTLQTDTYTIGSGMGESDYVALEVNGVDVPYVIQRVTGGGQGANGSDFLLPNQADYLSAGTRGLSLSFGTNKAANQDQEIFTFPVLTLNESKVGDDVVDIFVGDIAQNQSLDKWELLDSNGVTIASLIPQPHNASNPDWTEIGTQDLERVDTQTGILAPDNGQGFYRSQRSVYGLALELSDFQLEPAFGSGSLTSTEADSVASMRISIGETPSTQPKTDYAFFAADRDSITFDVGTSSSVPFEFSPTLGLILSGAGFSLMRLRRNL